MRSSAVRRVGSHIIDNFLMGFLQLFSLVFSWQLIDDIIELSFDLENGVITGSEYWKEYLQLQIDLLLAIAIPMTIFATIYMVVLPYFWNGKTIGRHIAGVHIKKLDDTKLEFWRIFAREVIFKILWWTVTLGIGAIVDFFTIIIREDKQTFRDIIMKTEVIEREGESVKKEYYDF